MVEKRSDLLPHSMEEFDWRPIEDQPDEVGAIGVGEERANRVSQKSKNETHREKKG